MLKEHDAPLAIVEISETEWRAALERKLGRTLERETHAQTLQERVEAAADVLRLRMALADVPAYVRECLAEMGTQQ